MIKDTGYAALFDKKDYPILQEMARRVRITHNQDWVNGFNNFLEARWNDKKINIQGVEPWQVSKSDPEDLVVNVGIDQMIAQILRTSTTRWQYMAKGTSGVANPTDTALGVEVSPRIDMSVNGWREYASSSLRFLGIAGESHATITVAECGVFTTSTAGIMLNHVNFANFPMTHTVNTSVFVISCIIEFVPVV